MKKILATMVKGFFVTLVIAWIIIVFMDYFKVRDGKNPQFCIKEEIKRYDDGTVYSCLGIGYKVYRYDRKSISASEFGPFFIKERTH